MHLLSNEANLEDRDFLIAFYKLSMRKLRGYSKGIARIIFNA